MRTIRQFNKGSCRQTFWSGYFSHGNARQKIEEEELSNTYTESRKIKPKETKRKIKERIRKHELIACI